MKTEFIYGLNIQKTTKKTVSIAARVIEPTKRIENYQRTSEMKNMKSETGCGRTGLKVNAAPSLHSPLGCFISLSFAENFSFGYHRVLTPKTTKGGHTECECCKIKTSLQPKFKMHLTHLNIRDHK
jgi:hypothetical protein